MKTGLEMLNDLCFEWLSAKNLENKFAMERREYEDKILNITNHNSNIEGSERTETSEYTIIITNRIDRKVHASILEDILKENDLNNAAQELFRWKPEINIKAWKNTHESITNQLKKAVDSKPGKPSFKITVKE